MGQILELGRTPDGDADPEEQDRRCPDWTELVDAGVEESLLALDEGVLSLTPKGRTLVLNERTRFRKKLPQDPDLRVVVGTVGTGNVVQIGACDVNGRVVLHEVLDLSSLRKADQ